MQRRTRQIVPGVLVELFFAVLPLFVLGANWPHSHESHPSSFVASPEWPMTACILYGLCLVRLTPAFHRNRGTLSTEHTERVNVLLLLPLFGVIASVILIGKLSSADPGLFPIVSSYANFGLAVLAFVVLGGYGMRSESHNRSGEL
jgi:hypothetical protein